LPAQAGSRRQLRIGWLLRSSSPVALDASFHPAAGCLLIGPTLERCGAHRTAGRPAQGRGRPRPRKVEYTRNLRTR